MDWLDWIVRGTGLTFGLLIVAFGFSRVSSFAERDISPLWWFVFSLVGPVWVIALVAGWVLPIATTVYLANGSKEPLPARIGKDQICIPAKSYDGFSWRLSTPETVIVGGGESGPEQSYSVGKGTWFINLSPIIVTADMYESSGSIILDALLSDQQGAIHVNSRLGRPSRMFSQSPLDRFYSPEGDIVRDSVAGPCPLEKQDVSGR
jgi:hypothetical protein